MGLVAKKTKDAFRNLLIQTLGPLKVSGQRQTIADRGCCRLVLSVRLLEKHPVGPLCET